MEADVLNDGLFRKWETSLSCPKHNVKSYKRLNFLISQILKKKVIFDYYFFDFNGRP